MIKIELVSFSSNTCKLNVEFDKFDIHLSHFKRNSFSFIHLPKFVFIRDYIDDDFDMVINHSNFRVNVLLTTGD